MARVIGKALIAFAVIAALLIIAALVITLREPKFVPVPMPNPNGYDDLLEAARTPDLSSFNGSEPTNQEQLGKFLAENAETLQLARTGLSRECRVPIEHSVEGIRTSRVYADRFRDLAGKFRLEGKLAELEKRPGEATRSYLTVARIGQEMCRGGAVIDALGAYNVEEMGLDSLRRLAGSLSVEECKQVIAALEAADGKRETVENVVRQEKVSARRLYGWRYYMHPIVIAQTRHRASTITVQSDHTRKLMITLAARAFELEHGAKPKSIYDLAPGYLKTIPKNAFTGKEMNCSP